MKKRVMILGASRYYLHPVMIAKSLGHEVVLIDKNPNSYAFRLANYSEGVDVADSDGALEVARKYKIDAIIPMNDFSVLTASYVARELGLVGNSLESALLATNKAKMKNRWLESGVPTARFVTASTLEEAYAVVDDFGCWPLIFKPADSRGGGSRGVSKVENQGQVGEAFRFAQSFFQDPTVIIEEFVDGIEHSVEMIVYKGQPFVLAVSDKEKTPPPHRVDKSVLYPTIFTGDELKNIEDNAIAAIKALGIEYGGVQVEMCTTRKGSRIFEIGARCGGGGTPDPITTFVSGVPMFEEVVRIALGDPPKRTVPIHSRGCVYRFLTPKPGRIKGVHGIDEVKKWDNVLDCDSIVRAGDAIRPVKTGLDRAGFVITGAETRDEAKNLADQAEEAITYLYDL